jgi:PAS domain S-box-containing protein
MTQLISEMTFQKLEQIQLNEALKKSEERSQSALDQMLEGCQIIGFDWRYIYLNRSAEIHNKRPNTELIGKRYMDIWPGIEETEVFHIIKKTLETRSSDHFENEFVFPDGSIGWFDLSILPVPEGVFMLSIDITERKRKEKLLFESEFRFDKLYENGPFGMVMADKEFYFKKANPAFCEIMGFNEDEIRKLTFKDITHPDDLEKDLSNIRKLANQEISVYKTEKRYIRKDRRVIWASLSVVATFSNDGQFLYHLGIIEDISHRKQAEEEIRHLNERISTATRASQVGIWDWDIVNNQLYWDDQMYTLYGLKKGEFTGAYEAWVNGLHPDDRESCQKGTQLAISGEKEYDAEFRVIWPDQTVRFLKAKGEVFRNETGEPVRMIGINYDITEQKEIDEKIRKKDQEFRKLSANVPDLIYQFTRRPDGSYYVPIASEGIRNIFGCAPEDVANDFTPIGRVLYPEDAERVIQDIEYSAEHLTHFNCEFRVQIPGKGIQWIYSNSSPEKLPDGSITWYGFNVDITQKKLANELIRMSEERYRNIFESAVVGIYRTTPDGKILVANPTLVKMLGFSSFDELSARNLEEEGFETNSNRDEFRRQIEKTGSLTAYESEWKTIGGKTLFISENARAFYDSAGNVIYYEGTIEDITERKRIERALRESEEIYRKAFKTSPDSINITRIVDGVYVSVNQGFIETIEYTEEELIGKSSLEINIWKNPEDRIRLVNGLKSNGLVRNLEAKFCAKSGRIIDGLMSAAIIEIEGVPHIISITRDISERINAEEEIRKLNETLEQRVIERTSQLEAANKELEAFSYSVSHDLRAPLRHINGYVDLLNNRFQDNLPDKARDYLVTISNAAKQMGLLIDDLLQFSRTGRQELRKTKLDMNILMNEVLQKVKPDIENRNINWSVKPLPEVFGDYSLLKQVWANLVDNAIKYTKYKEMTEIAIGFREEKDSFVFYIRDNGVGFDMKYAHKLFGVFQRLHAQSDFEGTGIGLANVQRIILKHNGHVRAEAEPDKGATFFFTLPKN